MKETIMAVIVMAALLICTGSHAEPYNGPSVLMVFEKNLDRGFTEYENKRVETWRECVLKMEAIQYSRGDGVTARCLPLHIEKEPEIVAEAQDYLTY
jgi:hypothetical protein